MSESKTERLMRSRTRARSRMTRAGISSMLLAASLLLLCPGCTQHSEGKATASGPRGEQPRAGSSTEKNTGGDAPVGKVKRIVFLDKESCCDCTRKRQDITWDNLQAALAAAPVKPAVEVIHLDSQADQAAVYTDLEPVMVPPALYFFDHEELLLDMVQGEIAQDQIEKILN